MKRWYISNDRTFYIFRQRSALGECLAAFAGAFPVAFLETHLNKHNTYSIYNTKSAKDRAGTLNASIHKYLENDFLYMFGNLYLCFLLCGPPQCNWLLFTISLVPRT